MNRGSLADAAAPSTGTTIFGGKEIRTRSMGAKMMVQVTLKQAGVKIGAVIYNLTPTMLYGYGYGAWCNGTVGAANRPPPPSGDFGRR
jgi:hypothetical protein